VPHSKLLAVKWFRTQPALVNARCVIGNLFRFQDIAAMELVRIGKLRAAILMLVKSAYGTAVLRIALVPSMKNAR
jgi:hypothetical protein